jgi:CubicO group peptidase (beta-lactamase class C family)
LETAVPGSARDFIAKELLGKLGISSYVWQDDVSGLPKAAAGSSMRSRDMLKWGLMVMNNGKWNGEQLVPAGFAAQAVSRLHTNAQGSSYGYFWWSEDVTVNGNTYRVDSGRGAGGQFIMMVPEEELTLVITAHNKGMGKMRHTAPQRIIPVFR